ncbi:MAG TPA: extracellular solute-binding protein [Clostridiales bacterium]|nr:extracellular solute-binding protein [Clostridiales bacterium]
MKIKKLVSLLIILAMAFSLVACGNKEDEKGKETETAPATSTSEDTDEADVTDEAEPVPTEEPVADKYPAFDFGGREIKVGIWWDYYYTSEHTDITDDAGLSNPETAQMKLDNVRRIEEKYNVRIKFVNLGWDGIIESINTSITAGTPECDIYYTDLQFGIPAAVNGLAQDLTSFVPADSDLFNDQIIMKPLEGLGGTYFFAEQGLPQNGIYLGYNATMLDELGLEDPRALFARGEWTWDKFAEYAAAGTQDTDNDGTVDIYGYGGVFTDFVNGLMFNNGGAMAATETESLSSQEVVETLEFIDRIYNQDKSGRPWNWDDWNDNLLAWSDGKVMFWTGQAWLLKQEADAAIAEGAELPFDYHVVPYPIGPSGDGTISSPVSGNWFIVPVGVQEPEKVFQVFEEFLNWHQGETELRDDPTWFESCFTTYEDVEIAFETGMNLRLDIWDKLSPGFDFGATIWGPIVVDKTSTVAQAVEAAKPVLQDAIDAFYSK